MSNAGPFAPLQSPRRTREPLEGMTEHRQAVLDKIEAYGSRANPLRLGDQQLVAARWLARKGFVVMVHDAAFAPMDGFDG